MSWRIVIGLISIISSTAYAQELAEGAIELPSGVRLSAPFPEGTEFMISCDYAPCTPAHKGTNDPSGINDHYALDMIRNQRGNGRGELVTTALPGEVVYAGWGQHGRSIYGRLVMVRHSSPDGHDLVSFYAHLSKILVKVGDTIPAKAPIGHMGGSAWGKDDKLAPHLHFGLHSGAGVRGGPVGGRAIRPEPLDGARGLHKEQILTAGNGITDAIYLVVDDESEGFSLHPDTVESQVHRIQPSEREQYIYGTAETWTGPEGYGPESRFKSVEAPTDALRASWRQQAPKSGMWQAQIFIPRSDGATATALNYQLQMGESSSRCIVDQSASQGWVMCGQPLHAKQGAILTISLHAEPDEVAGERIALDAIRFIWRGESERH